MQPAQFRLTEINLAYLVNLFYETGSWDACLKFLILWNIYVNINLLILIE